MDAPHLCTHGFRTRCFRALRRGAIRAFALGVFAPATLAVLLTASSAALAAPTPKERAEARALATDGRKALKDKRWTDAIAALKKADKLDPSPALEVDLAQALAGAGKLVDARKVLKAAVDAADATPAGKRARDAAAKAADDLDARIPTVKVKVTGAPADSTTTQIDGIDVDASSPIQVNPGDHTVSASADGYVSAETQMHFDEGAVKTIPFKLVRVKKAAAADDGARATGSRVPGAVVTSIGGAVLIGGAITGGLAISASNAAKNQFCDVANQCLPGAQTDISQSKTFGNISTGMFIGGGVVAAVGIVLIIVAPGGSKPDDAAKSARLSPWVGPGLGGVGVRGSF
jgi:hypothetical protein